MRCHLRADRNNPEKEFASIVLTPDEIDGFRAALLFGLKRAETGRVIDMFGHVTRVSVTIEFLRPCSPEEDRGIVESGHELTTETVTADV